MPPIYSLTFLLVFLVASIKLHCEELGVNQDVSDPVWFFTAKLSRDGKPEPCRAIHKVDLRTTRNGLVKITMNQPRSVTVS
jgi:hypothetical protein